MAKLQKIIMGNFKCNPVSYSKHRALMEIYRSIKLSEDKKLVVFPQAVLAQDTIDSLASQGIEVGIQFVSDEASGAYTAQNSPELAASMGIKYALIHQSEHVQYLGVTLDKDRDRIRACISNGLIPVICVGETLDEHNAGQGEEVVRQQLQSLLTDSVSEYYTFVIVYEPLWAIGTGKTITVAEADTMCGVIREYLEEHYSGNAADSVYIVFGGSVNPTTAAQFGAQPNISGALVGGASLKGSIVEIYEKWG